MHDSWVMTEEDKIEKKKSAELKRQLLKSKASHDLTDLMWTPTSCSYLQKRSQFKQQQKRSNSTDAIGEDIGPPAVSPCASITSTHSSPPQLNLGVVSPCASLSSTHSSSSAPQLKAEINNEALPLIKSPKSHDQMVLPKDL